MAEDAMSRITLFIQFFLIAFAILLVVLLLQYVWRLRLRRRLRQIIAADSDHDLVGRSAVLVRSARHGRSGQIQIEYQEDVYTFKAISDQPLPRGQTVRITAVTREGFKVTRQDIVAADPNLTDRDSTLRRSVVQDINVESREVRDEDTL